jgi:hypothetical protein
MSKELEVMSRRRALSLLGLAALSLAVPTVLTVSDGTVSDAEAQAAPPAAPAAGPQTGTERGAYAARSGVRSGAQVAGSDVWRGAKVANVR